MKKETSEKIFTEQLKKLNISRTQLASALNMTTLTLAYKINGDRPWQISEAEKFQQITKLSLVCDGDSKTTKISKK